MTAVVDFIHAVRFSDLPASVVRTTRRCLLDLIGVAAGGRRTQLADIACRYATAHLCSHERGARILFDGRKVSVSGAAFAGASMIDALDAHDGHPLTKGHAGAALLPTLAALADAQDGWEGDELLVSLALGYEIAIRAGIALHASACDYHTSGAWNALGCAAITARWLRLDRQQTREALGIAEYHGPRSQMMRCIAHPTMVKDGSGWGALAGTSAAFLAAEGFTGAPAVTVESDEHAHLWSDLGSSWLIEELYFKPEPICRWAQPATEAVRILRTAHDIRAEDVAEVRIETFDAAVRLGLDLPVTTEQAQYALGYPVAVMLKRGRVGPEDVLESRLGDSEVAQLCSKMTLVPCDDHTARFPRERVAVVAITIKDGQTHRSAETTARGDHLHPLTDDEIEEKFHSVAAAIPMWRRLEIIEGVRNLSSQDGAELLRLMTGPI